MGIDTRLIDGAGRPIREAINWRDGSLGTCMVPGCDHLTQMYGWLRWGGPIGYVCSDHREDADALDALILGQRKPAED